MWYHTIGESSLHPSCKEQVRSLILANDQTFAVHPTKRVWISVYCKASMYDLAWEHRNYEDSWTIPQIHEIVREKHGASHLRRSVGTGQLESSRCKHHPLQSKTIKRIQEKHGHFNPYSKHYK
jgi:hypothetical protein